MRQTPKVVVFLGPDGAGKTTIIGLIESIFIAQSVDYARYYYAPGFLKRYRQKLPVVITKNPHEGRQYGSFLVFAKIMLMLFEFRIGVPISKRRNHISLFDRFIHDLLVDPKRYRMQRTRWWMRVMLKLAPTPDLCILVCAPVSIVQSRKQEVPIEETIRQLDAYRSVMGLFPNSIVVENIGPPELLAKQIVGEIFTR